MVLSLLLWLITAFLAVVGLAFAAAGIYGLVNGDLEFAVGMISTAVIGIALTVHGWKLQTSKPPSEDP